MNLRTSISSIKLCNPLCVSMAAMCILTALTFSPAFATDTLNLSFSNNGPAACQAGFANTWIVTQSCDLGKSADVKVNDAINIYCDATNGNWTVEFYLEPLGNIGAGQGSQAVAYSICPGNGRLVKTADADVMLQCNYWDSGVNTVKQLELELQPVTSAGVRQMDWLVREVDNPNVVCGISGRPEDDQAKGTSTTLGN